MKKNQIRISRLRKLSLLLFHFALATINLHAQKNKPASSFKSFIAFTTLNSVKLEVRFKEIMPNDSKYSLKIIDERSGQSIYDESLVAQKTRDDDKLLFTADNIKADPWLPAHPVLYKLIFSASSGEKINEQIQRIGFRLFESKDGNLYLNGKPIFLRGIAINPPARGIPDTIEKSRKFAEEYVRFMKSIHVNIIRIPNDETWYSVCDELGMMVFGGNYSGEVDNEKPPTDYDKAVTWYEQNAFASISSHPCLMIYAMTNEVPFEGAIADKWEKFLSYAYQKLSAWDNTRLFIANAGYGYGKSGDICDLHRYWGWYYCSPFTFLNIRNNALIIPFKKLVQPITFTECVGNYTGPDGKYNLTPDHKNPGSQLNWTGHASWNDQSRLADEHQSFTFKQATELNRRLRSINHELSGVFPFTILFYNWNNVQQFVDMDPKPVTKQVKLSYQPVLISWENWKTQVYSGSTINPVVHIVNDDDDFNDLSDAKFIFSVKDKGGLSLVTDSIELPSITYYHSWQQALSIKLPAQMMRGDYELSGRIMKGGKLISENEDRIFVSNQNHFLLPAKKILLYDPSGKTFLSLDQLHIPYQKISTFKSLPVNATVVIGENDADDHLAQQSAEIRQFVKNGGRILLLRQDEMHFSFQNKILAVPLKNITVALDVPVYPPPPRPSKDGYYINPERPDHPVFDGIDREQLKVWSDYTNWNETMSGFPSIYPVTDGYVPVNKKDLGQIAVLGNYGVALEGIALSEISEGKGSVLVCGLDLTNRTGLDPVSDRMLSNLVNYMADGKQHELYPLITAPIVWGDYATEKGVLTGVNSGLMVHSVPLVPDNVKSKITVTKEGNRFLGAPGGFNTRPGIQYVAYGRRIYGPYYLRGFGNIPEPVDTSNNVGQGFFWCRIPSGKTKATTLVWNQDVQDHFIKIKINDGPELTKEIKAGERTMVDCPLKGTNIKMEFKGDRRLVLLQTEFK